MRILVCGGRDYSNDKFLNEELDKHQFTCLITGMARGADTLAWLYAKRKDIPTAEFRADWKRFGKRAGFLRNEKMLVEGKPDLVIAFPGGAGTAMMCQIAYAAGVKVIHAAPV